MITISRFELVLFIVMGVLVGCGIAVYAMGPRIPGCAEDDVISREGQCTHPDIAEWRQGYWEEVPR